MALLGHIISRSLNIRKALASKRAHPRVYQLRTLRKLLEKAQYTAFGKHYEFENILLQPHDFEKHFLNNVPIHDYNSMFNQWWHKLLKLEENITWPGRVKYFALSSGTSESSSKHIPVTSDMIKSIKNVAFKQFFSLSNFNIPPAVFDKGVLMLGGSTSLQDNGGYYEGDMSGISAKNIPRLLSNIYYKPGQKIARAPSWEERIELIVENAPNWNVGTLCGVPSWVQLVLEKIIERYKLNNIHDIWPNLGVYIHGGVAFEPYRDFFKKMMGKPVTFIETYMASEGSFGFKARPKAKGIKLILNSGIFYEFLPFNEENFDDDGNIKGTPKTFLIDEVTTGQPYAVILSTCAGAWRYLIGDVVEFTHVEKNEIILVGRTKQFLSICGEHTSVDNLNTAIEHVIKELDIRVSDFSVAGYTVQNHFAHHWYIGTNATHINGHQVAQLLDEKLREINDDYAVERDSALKDLYVTILPEHVFEDYMRAQGKFGAMNKFPRVLKGHQLESWKEHLQTHMAR